MPRVFRYLSGGLVMTRRLLVTLAILTLPRLVLAQTEEVQYLHSDAIGSVRLVTDANGQVLKRYDYLPFGEPYPPPAPVAETRRFGGKGARQRKRARLLRHPLLRQWQRAVYDRRSRARWRRHPQSTELEWLRVRPEQSPQIRRSAGHVLPRRERQLRRRRRRRHAGRSRAMPAREGRSVDHWRHGDGVGQVETRDRRPC